MTLSSDRRMLHWTAMVYACTVSKLAPSCAPTGPSTLWELGCPDMLQV